MRLPRGEQAVVPRDKLLRYLLSDTHPVGRHKAAAFARAGFQPSDWLELEAQLLDIARSEEIAQTLPGVHGTKYAIDGQVGLAGSERMWTRTVWILEEESGVPHLVTAYPRRPE